VATAFREAATFLSSTAPGWFDMAEARDKMLKGQAVFLDRLSEALAL
jgi:predicted NUDIX family NTP pyrophosphohydrolase